MGEFAGYIRLDGAPVAPEVIACLSDSVLSAGSPRVWHSASSAVFIEGLGPPTLPLTVTAAPEQSWQNRIVLADGWLEAAGDVAQALGRPSGTPDRALMAAAIMAWGIEPAADRLHGEHALALWEEDSRRLTLARDAFGARPIYYYAASDFILFATTLQTMLAHPETPRDLDPVIVAHTMTQAQLDPEQTIYRHVRRVLPGGVAVFERGKLAIRRYYSAERIPTVRLGSDEAYVEAARELFDRAVACRLPSSGPFATELSGGFDSGGVAATAARILDPQILTAYTRVPAQGFANGSQGERELAGKLVAMYPNIAWAIIDDACEVEGDLNPEQEADALLVPRVDSFHRAWFESLVRAAQGSGAPILLNGGIGNITLSYHGNSAFAALPPKAWPGAMLRMHRSVRANGGSIPRALATVGYHALAPRGIRRMRVRMRDGRLPWLQYCMLSPDFLAEIDYDSHAQAVGHDVPFEPPVDHREIRLRFLQSQRGRDSRGYIRRRWSIQSRDPYRDRKLAEFCLGVPNDQYYRDGQDRWLARRVLADRVPAETLTQTQRGLQVPEWYGLASARRDGMAAAVDRIARSPAAGRVLDMPRIRAVLDNWPKDAEAAESTRDIHGHALQRAISMGGFLLWHETYGE